MGQVLQFRRPVAEVAPVEIREPTPHEVSSVIIAAIVTSMPDKARIAFYNRFQKMFDRAAGNAERQNVVKIAAEWIDAPLKTQAG